MTNPNDVAQIKHLDSLASHVNVLGSASSTVEGGLWFEFKDGLPIVKMNYGGDDFILDTRPAEDTLIGDKIYLGGHEFKLTGFADGLTFSGNNFYTGGNSAPIGSVSNFAFQFTDAGALNVAYGDTISITQLDTDTVNYSLDLDSLNTDAKPWYFHPTKAKFNQGIYTYNGGKGSTYRRTSATAYITSGDSTEKQLTLNLAPGLKPDDFNILTARNNPDFAADKFPYVSVDEIYDSSGTLKEFHVTIKSNDAIFYDEEHTDPLETLTATAPEGVTVSIKFDGTTYGDYRNSIGFLTRDETTGVYTFTTDKTATIFGDKDFSLSISGLPDLGKLVFCDEPNGVTIRRDIDVTTTTDSATTTTVALDAKIYGKFRANGKRISFGNEIDEPNLFTLRDAGYPTITISGNNDWNMNGYVYLKSAVSGDSTAIDFSVDTYNAGYLLTNAKKTLSYHSEGKSVKRLYLTPPSGYTTIRKRDTNENLIYIAHAVYWQLTAGSNPSTDILFAEFNGQDWVLNSHAFDGVTTADTINITNIVNSTPLNFNFELATDADTVAISRTFANETFTAGATAGTYTYTATGTTAGWNVSMDGSKIASWELNGKSFTIENLRTDLGNLGFDSQGYIHATNGSTIGRMGGNVIKLYDTAVHKLATPILTGADAADFTLILPS